MLITAKELTGPEAVFARFQATEEEFDLALAIEDELNLMESEARTDG